MKTFAIILVLISSEVDQLLWELDMPNDLDRLQERLLYDDYPGKIDPFVDPFEFQEQYAPSED